jgi:hypothetical protein
MSIGSSIASALAGGLCALAGLTYVQSHPPTALSALFGTAVAAPQAETAAAVASPRTAELRTTLRRLLAERAAYSRNSLISIVANTSDLAAVNARLLKNQDEIAAALRPYYGEESAAKLTKLLRDEVALGTAAIRAVRGGDKAKLTVARKNWSDSGAAIAAFFSAANPNWQKGEMEQFLQKQVDLTLREATARQLRDWPADIRAHDERRQHILGLADTLADGVAKQFPAKFIG